MLNEAGITMNGQIVLCKGIKDGEELQFSIKELMKYIPNLESVSVVPVGLSKYREGLYPLEPFTAEDAKEVLNIIHGFQKECFDKYGMHFIHASDEWYILAGEELPEEERYDGYLQLENGVGMLRLLLNEFDEALADAAKKDRHPVKKEAKGLSGLPGKIWGKPATQEPEAALEESPKYISMATGRLAYPYIRQMADRMMEAYPRLHIDVYEIVNEFFGEMITVSGLLTGQDILKQLTGKPLGDILLLPQNVLRSGERVFLDDLTVDDLEKALQVPINIVKSSGYDFVETILNV